MKAEYSKKEILSIITDAYNRFRDVNRDMAYGIGELLFDFDAIRGIDYDRQDKRLEVIK